MNKFDDLPDMIMGMLKSKQLVIKTIISDIEKCQNISKGLEKCTDSVITNPSEENLRKMLNTSMKCISKQSDIITKLLIVALMYCGGDNYDSDATTILNKLGRGKEALRHIFKNKFGGL